VSTNVGFDRCSNFCSIYARFHSADVFHRSANDCHNLRSFLFADLAESYRCLREERGSSSPFTGRRPTPARFKILRALGMSARAARSAI
jgi:hypothetical protein